MKEINKNFVLCEKLGSLKDDKIKLKFLNNGSYYGQTYFEILNKNKEIIFSTYLQNKEIKDENYYFKLKNRVETDDYYIKVWSNVDKGIKVETKKYTEPGLISVIIPHYNRSKMVQKTIDSILNQTYNHTEIIIADDCSNANELKTLKNYLKKYPDIRLVELQKNSGAPTARNEGAVYASGQFYFFCDSDVILYKDAFQSLIQKAHENPDCGWVYGNFKWGENIHKFYEFNVNRFYKQNCTSTMSLIKSKYFTGWKENLKRLQDWDLYLTILETYNKMGVYLDKLLFETPIDKNGVTENSISYEEAIKKLKEYHKGLKA